MQRENARLDGDHFILEQLEHINVDVARVCARQEMRNGAQRLFKMKHGGILASIPPFLNQFLKPACVCLLYRRYRRD